MPALLESHSFSDSQQGLPFQIESDLKSYLQGEAPSRVQQLPDTQPAFHSTETQRYYDLKVKSFNMAAQANKNADMQQYLIYPLNLKKLKN